MSTIDKLIEKLCLGTKESRVDAIGIISMLLEKHSIPRNSDEFYLQALPILYYNYPCTALEIERLISSIGELLPTGDDDLDRQLMWALSKAYSYPSTVPPILKWLHDHPLPTEILEATSIYDVYYQAIYSLYHLPRTDQNDHVLPEIKHLAEIYDTCTTLKTILKLGDDTLTLDVERLLGDFCQSDLENSTIQ